MSDAPKTDWDFFPREIEGHVAAIFVDLNARSTAPDKAFGHVGSIMLKMQAPNDEGTASKTESDNLIAIEDGLMKALAANNDAAARYVGRVTSQGHREFFFYTNAPTTWAEQVRVVMRAFPVYRFESDTYADAAWRTYFEFLAPTKREMQHIQNRRVCMSLEKHGDRMVNLREVDHYIYFTNSIDRQRFIDAVKAFQFQVRGMMEPDHQFNTYGVQIFRIDVPAFESIDELTLPLVELAHEHKGEYDGWETQVMAEKH
jgi:uncharacterized protein (TIGR01619 family)